MQAFKPEVRTSFLETMFGEQQLWLAYQRLQVLAFTSLVSQSRLWFQDSVGCSMLEPSGSSVVVSRLRYGGASMAIAVSGGGEVHSSVCVGEQFFVKPKKT